LPYPPAASLAKGDGKPSPYRQVIEAKNLDSVAALRRGGLCGEVLALF
jgi:hypothetical protein